MRILLRWSAPCKALWPDTVGGSSCHPPGGRDSQRVKLQVKEMNSYFHVSLMPRAEERTEKTSLQMCFLTILYT